jgi:hypothetical protein
MARKRKKTSRRRRSRVGAIKGGNITSILGIVAGAVAGRLVAKKVLPNVDEKIKNAGVIALGAFGMPMILKSELGKAIGNGMIASGGAGLLGSFIPAIAGVEEDFLEFPVQVGEVDDDISVISGDDVMAGANDVMAGDDELAILSGMDEDDEY